jgi:small-conductance mechanosensitive channel
LRPQVFGSEAHAQAFCAAENTAKADICSVNARVMQYNKAMQSAASTGSSNNAEVMSMSAAELSRLVQSQAETITSLQQQLDWFRR